jgi:hypothetical protein
VAPGDAAPIAAKDAAADSRAQAQLDCSGGIVAGASRAGSRADRTSSLKVLFLLGEGYRCESTHMLAFARRQDLQPEVLDASTLAAEIPFTQR